MVEDLTVGVDPKHFLLSWQEGMGVKSYVENLALNLKKKTHFQTTSGTINTPVGSVDTFRSTYLFLTCVGNRHSQTLLRCSCMDVKYICGAIVGHTLYEEFVIISIQIQPFLGLKTSNWVNIFHQCVSFIRIAARLFEKSCGSVSVSCCVPVYCWCLCFITLYSQIHLENKSLTYE